MLHAVLVKLLKGNALWESHLTGGARKFPHWDKLDEPVHSGTDCLFLVLIHPRQTYFTLLRLGSFFLVQQRLLHRL
jgi:hypothetical protein